MADLQIKSYLGKTLKVTLKNGRVAIGKLALVDYDGNVILLKTTQIFKIGNI